MDCRIRPAQKISEEDAQNQSHAALYAKEAQLEALKAYLGFVVLRKSSPWNHEDVDGAYSITGAFATGSLYRNSESDGSSPLTDPATHPNSSHSK